jgi:sn-glycerol 3-phosphate transport system substrate-binding protein
MAVTLAACGSSTSTSSAPKTAAATSCPLSSLDRVTKPVDITFWEAMSQANGTTLKELTTQFNASQSKVHVTLVDENSYTAIWQKYVAGLSSGQVPDLAQLTQTDLQAAIDTHSFLPAQSCIDAAHYSTSDFVSRALSYYQVDGVQEALPFAVSLPVVYYNKQAFTAAGLNPDDPPLTLPAYLSDAAALKAHGSGSALVLDSWHLETWLATANQLFVNNGNGRTARATKGVFDTATAKQIWTDLDHLVRSGDAVTNPSSGPDAFDNLLGLGDGKYGMTIDSSADLGTITQLLSSYPHVTMGVGPFPVLSKSLHGGVEPGGSAIYISAKVPAVQQAAAWEYEAFLDSSASQATWAAGTGYIPVRKSSVQSSTIKKLWATNPGFKVAYTELVDGPTTLATTGAVIGPYPTVRTDMLDAEESMYQQNVSPATALKNALRKVDATITSYNQRIGVS